MKFRCLLIFSLFLFAGCATTPLNPDISKDLQTKKNAFAFFLEEKSIQYDEMVYKVLWNQTESQTSTFEGFWDVDQDLTEIASREMVALNLNTVSIRSVLEEDEAYDSFLTSVKATRGADGNTPLILDDDMIERFRQDGISYVIVIRGAKFVVNTTSMTSAGYAGVPSIMFVYSIKDEKEVYQEYFPWGTDKVAWGDSVRNLESDNLAELKKGARSGLKIAVNKHVPEIIGIVK